MMPHTRQKVIVSLVLIGLLFFIFTSGFITGNFVEPTSFEPSGELRVLGEISRCTNLTTDDTVYTLTANLTGVQEISGICINITGTNITLDCDFYSIICNETCNYAVEVNTSSNVTLKNCMILNYTKAGILIQNSNNTALSNLFFDLNNNAIILANGTNGTLVENCNVSESTGEDILLLSNSHNNTFLDFRTNNTISSFTYGGNLRLKSATQSASEAPENHVFLPYYLSITNESSDAWIFINISYTDSEISGIIEDSIKIWKNSSGGWNQELNLTGDLVSGVDTADNYGYANISNLSSVFVLIGRETFNISVVSPENTSYIGNESNLLWFNLTTNRNASNCSVIIEDIAYQMENISTTEWYKSFAFTTEGIKNATFECNSSDSTDNDTSDIIYFTIDWTKPNIHIRVPEDYERFNSRTFVISVNTDEDAYSCKAEFNNNINQTLSSSDSREWSSESPYLENGNHTMKAYCRDIAGNWNISETVSFRLQVQVTSPSGSSPSAAASLPVTRFDFTNVLKDTMKLSESLNETLDITRMGLLVSENTHGWVGVRELTEKPANTQNVSGVPFKYFIFSASNIPYSRILDAEIQFRVPKAWIVSNDIDADTVSLYRHAVVWEKLSTSMIDVDSTYYYFKANTKAFSYFAITGDVVEKIEDIPEPVQEPQIPVTPAPAAICGDGICDISENSISCPEDCAGPTAEQKGTGIWVLIISVVAAVSFVAIGFILFMIFVKPRLFKTEEEPEFYPETSKEQVLEAYVRKNLSAGHSHETVESALLKVGWTKEHISRAFGLAMAPPQKTQMMLQYVQKQISKGFSPEQVKDKLVSSGWSSKQAEEFIKKSM